MNIDVGMDSTDGTEGCGATGITYGARRVGLSIRDGARGKGDWLVQTGNGESAGGGCGKG